MASEFRILERIVAPYCKELHPKLFKDRFILLNEQFKMLCLRNGIQVLSFSETEKTPIPYLSKVIPKYIRHIVPPKYADPGYGAFALIPNVNHTRMCCLSRPDDRLTLLLHLIFS